MRRKLIIGHNGAPEGEDALTLGRNLAEALDAHVVVTTVVEHPRHGVDRAEYEEAVSSFCEPIFESARERLNGVAMVERPIINYSRSAAIYELADWERPSMIVIGSAHRGPAGRILLGSLGESLLSGAPCGVAVAPRGYAEGERALERIGVALDGSSESWHALEAAAVLAGRTDTPLRLLSVLEPPRYTLGGLLSELGPEEYRDFKEREAAAVFDQARERVEGDLALEARLLHGSPAEELAAAAADLDLLVIGSRGYGPVKRAMLGSVSAKLIVEAPCPLLVQARGSGTHPLED